MNGSVSPPGTFVLRRGLERLRTSAMVKQSLLVFTAGDGSQRLRLRRACRCQPRARGRRVRRTLRAYQRGFDRGASGRFRCAGRRAARRRVSRAARRRTSARLDRQHRGRLSKTWGSSISSWRPLGVFPFARFLHVPIWSLPFVGLIAGVALSSTRCALSPRERRISLVTDSRMPSKALQRSSASSR